MELEKNTISVDSISLEKEEENEKPKLIQPQYQTDSFIDVNIQNITDGQHEMSIEKIQSVQDNSFKDSEEKVEALSIRTDIQTTIKDQFTHLIDADNKKIKEEKKPHKEEKSPLAKEDKAYREMVRKAKLQTRKLLVGRCSRCGSIGHTALKCKNAPRFINDILDEIKEQNHQNVWYDPKSSLSRTNQKLRYVASKKSTRNFHQQQQPEKKLFCSMCKEFGHTSTDCYNYF
ncbi:hypothetical protein EIN_485500 [Entamoeba invadens IP1]|uniref:CCHC-type domain-containing protein n=1 Tax=Entamoeba invadens IP1 TaxID=370355 RepID=A0A0A1UAE0_ENTIV|nr:hypothetical protein EIN_485500 [Entamoeba invadens IP1]ELP89158.1 hypothetical protein EIN_485500 [Entamoeba invadens IP1]|eukprot:XP_004255929.1 hypothetical protein EIN_485500 [Entamoeba invadens IP1]